jgi:GTPase SAR1 family protein
LTRPDSLPSVEHYFRQLRLASPGAAIVFVGNKSDLVADRQLKTSKAGLANLASTLNTSYILTSAKTGENVKWAFELLAGLIERSSCFSL